MFLSLIKQENFNYNEKQNTRVNLHIPDVKHKITINRAFLENTVVFPPCAENIDSASILGIETSESCNIQTYIEHIATTEIEL